MKIYKSRLSLIVAIIYLTALIYSLHVFFQNDTYNKFTALYLVALTFPWSIVLTFSLDLLGIIDTLPDKNKAILLMIGSLPNAIFLYWITAKIENAFRNRK